LKQKLAATPPKVVWQRGVHDCPFFEMIDDDAFHCRAEGKVFEPWCSTRKINVPLEIRDGKLYCNWLKRYVKSDCYIANPEYAKLASEVSKLEDAIKSAKSSLHNIIPNIEKVLSYLSAAGFVEARFKYIYFCEQTFIEERVYESGSCSIVAYKNSNDEVLAVYIALTVIDMNVAHLYININVNLPPPEVCESLRLIARVKEALDRGRSIEIDAKELEMLKKASGNELFEEKCIKLFSKPSNQLIPILEELQREAIKRKEEEKRKREEEKRRKEEEMLKTIKNAFRELEQYVEITIDNGKITAKTKRYMSKEIFDKYISTAKAMKMQFNTKTKAWELWIL